MSIDWESTKRKYPLGCQVDATINKTWKLGALLEVEDGAQCILRNKELEWDTLVEDLTTYPYEGDILRVGRKIKVSVIRYDNRKRLLVCSLRRALNDPWELHKGEYSSGSRIRGKVISINRDNAYLEFENHLNARLPRSELVPWNLNGMDELLEINDWVEAKVTQIDDENRELIVSMKDRLEEIGQELIHPGEGESIWITQPAEEKQVKSNGELISATRAGLRKVESILLVDDKEDQLLLLDSLLEVLGYENADSETDFARAVETAIQRDYDLFFIDVKNGNIEYAGIDAAEKIKKAKPGAKIVLVTGAIGDEWRESSRRGQILELAGMVFKPILIDDLRNTISNIEHVGHAGWPIPLDVNDQKAVEFVKNISKAASARSPLPQTLQDILDKIVEVTGAEKAAIFCMDPRTYEVSMPASIKILPESFKDWKYKLHKSPVNDVIYKGEHIHVGDVRRYEHKFRYLYRMVPCNSCLGIPVTGAAGELGYGLFLFHSRYNHFTENDLVRAEATAPIIGQAIRDHWLVEQIAVDQRLTLLGGAITSIGHELRGRVGALASIDSLAHLWKSLKKDATRLSDPDFVQKVERNLEMLYGAREGMDNLTDILLGAVKQNQEKVTDAVASLRSAISMVVHQATKAHVEILPELSSLPPVKGNRLELEQVFMNVMLNAIQQMTTARLSRGRLSIEAEYRPEDRQYPVKVRFTDTGPGIHYKYLDKIFEPMFTTKEKGTGMGLYICRELLAMMGGRIQVEQTTILVGTTFLVEMQKA